MKNHIQEQKDRVRSIVTHFTQNQNIQLDEKSLLKFTMTLLEKKTSKDDFINNISNLVDQSLAETFANEIFSSPQNTNPPSSSPYRKVSLSQNRNKKLESISRSKVDELGDKKSSLSFPNKKVNLQPDSSLSESRTKTHSKPIIQKSHSPLDTFQRDHSNYSSNNSLPSDYSPPPISNHISQSSSPSGEHSYSDYSNLFSNRSNEKQEKHHHRRHHHHHHKLHKSRSNYLDHKNTNEPHSRRKTDQSSYSDSSTQNKHGEYEKRQSIPPPRKSSLFSISSQSDDYSDEKPKFHKTHPTSFHQWNDYNSYSERSSRPKRSSNDYSRNQFDDKPYNSPRAEWRKSDNFRNSTGKLNEYDDYKTMNRHKSHRRYHRDNERPSNHSSRMSHLRRNFGKPQSSDEYKKPSCRRTNYSQSSDYFSEKECSSPCKFSRRRNYSESDSYYEKSKTNGYSNEYRKRGKNNYSTSSDYGENFIQEKNKSEKIMSAFSKSQDESSGYSEEENVQSRPESQRFLVSLYPIFHDTSLEQINDAMERFGTVIGIQIIEEENTAIVEFQDVTVMLNASIQEWILLDKTWAYVQYAGKTIDQIMYDLLQSSSSGGWVKMNTINVSSDGLLEYVKRIHQEIQKP